MYSRKAFDEPNEGTLVDATNVKQQKKHKTMKESLNHDDLMKLAEHFFAIRDLKQEIRKHEQDIYRLIGLQVPEEKPKEKEFPSMSKTQLAKAAGVNPRTFRRELRPHQAKLEELGSPRSSKILTPKAVEFLCELLDIDISDLQKNN